MAKLTKELQRNCIAALRNAAKGEFQFSPQRMYDLADALAACECEEEPLLLGGMDGVTNQIHKHGWDHILTRGNVYGFHNKGRYLELVCDADRLRVVQTRYCPTDLLDGRLAALDEEVSRGK